jgi:hypothetical protein
MNPLRCGVSIELLLLPDGWRLEHRTRILSNGRPAQTLLRFCGTRQGSVDEGTVPGGRGLAIMIRDLHRRQSFSVGVVRGDTRLIE